VLLAIQETVGLVQRAEIQVRLVTAAAVVTQVIAVVTALEQIRVVVEILVIRAQMATQALQVIQVRLADPLEVEAQETQLIALFCPYIL
jgi:hypothetical protein